MDRKYLTMGDALLLCQRGPVTILRASLPFSIALFNKHMTNLLEYQQHELEGKTLIVLFGAETDVKRYTEMMIKVAREGFANETLILYNKSGFPVKLRIDIQPVVTQSAFGEYYISYLTCRMKLAEEKTKYKSFYLSSCNCSNDSYQSSVGQARSQQQLEDDTVTSELTGSS